MIPCLGTALQQTQRFVRVTGGFGDHLEVALSFQHAPVTLPDDGVIVDKQDDKDDPARCAPLF